jgi:hypothetical protein
MLAAPIISNPKGISPAIEAAGAAKDRLMYCGGP